MKGVFMNDKLFTRDFSLVVIGQIISLFGNSILRFALPLYLLNETGSASLFGVVTACSFIPMILLSPAGGIVADRVNKRNIMVILDYATSALILLFTAALGHVSLVLLLIITLMLLYGIQGAYQPAVQASLPVLISPDRLLSGNAVINQVNALANLIGPVAGGALYGFYGICPILYVSIVCFLFSATMELFIHIPFKKPKKGTSVFVVVKQDLSDSFRFIRTEQPVIGKGILIVCAFNLFLSALIIVGLPVIITQFLHMSSQLYGYAQGALALGGLLGGILTGVFAKRLNIQGVHVLLLLSGAALLPIGLVLNLDILPMAAYIVITLCSFFMMVCSTMFTVQMLSFVQILTPHHLIGKVISCIMALSMCSQPLGQAVYGVLFDVLKGQSYFAVYGACLICCLISWKSRKIFRTISLAEPAAE